MKQLLQRMRVRRKVLVTMLAVAIPALVTFSALIIGTTAHILRKNASRRVSDLAAGSAAGLADLVQRSRKTLSTMAASSEVSDCLARMRQSDPPALAASLSRLNQAFLGWQRLDPTLQAIRLVDPACNVLAKVREGKVIPTSGPPRPPYMQPAVHSVAGRVFFTEALRLKRGRIWISNLERGKVEEEDDWCPAMVRFSIPLFLRDGSPGGVMLINVWGVQAGSLINRLISNDQGSAFLVERNLVDRQRNGIYLFHQDSDCQFGDQTGSHRTVFNDYPQAITSAWMTTDQGVAIDPRSSDILAHSYYSPYNSPDHGWVVVINARRGFFLEPLAAIGRLTLLWGLLVLAISVAVSLFFARSLTRPIQALLEGIRRIGENPAARIPGRMSDEVGFLATEINRMADAIQQQMEDKCRVEEHIRTAEKLASVGEMAAGLAHELNTPLGNIKALAILARKDIEAGRLKQVSLATDLGDIADQAGKCSGIITGLLSFARRDPPAPACHAPADLAREAMALVRLRAEKKGVACCLDGDAGEKPILVDGNQLRQVFVNILLNAIDAAPERDGEVVVSFCRSDDGLRISFRDNGPGIPPEHLGLIFDPFFTTKEVGQGTGLGLSVSYGMINAMGGRIEVTQSTGNGACFTVIIPGN